jgi:hypothetical protein
MHLPHWRVLPQPSSAVPHSNPSAAQLVGMHPLLLDAADAVEPLDAAGVDVVLDAAVPPDVAVWPPALLEAAAAWPPAPDPAAVSLIAPLPHAVSATTTPATIASTEPSRTRHTGVIVV